MKNLSQNSIEELAALMRELQHQIDRYSHVSEHLPKSLTKGLEKFQNKVLREMTRRENEY